MGTGSGEDRRLPPRRRCDEDVLDRFVVELVVGVEMVVVVVVVEFEVVVLVSGMGEYQFRFPLGVDVDRVGLGDAPECPSTGEIGMGTEILDRRWRGDTEGGWEVLVVVCVVVGVVVVGWIITERRRPGTGDALTGRRRWGGGASTFAVARVAVAAAVEGGLLLPMNSVCFFLPAGDCPSRVRKAEG